MSLIWAIIVAVAVGISTWAILKKKLGSIPLVLGIWLFLLMGYLAMVWFPPTPAKLLALGLLAGFSVALIIWGLVNVAIQRMALMHEVYKKVIGGKEYSIVFWKPMGAHYGVLYGLLPWDDEGATLFYHFINENIWNKGLKITNLNIELEVFGNLRIAWIWGLVEPKTIIDRILY